MSRDVMSVLDASTCRFSVMISSMPPGNLYTLSIHYLHAQSFSWNNAGQSIHRMTDLNQTRMIKQKR